MKTWKSKLFGDNRTNFYGWIAAGIFAVASSIWATVSALQGGALESPTGLLFLAIYIVLVGQFCLNLQNYCARVAALIEDESEG